MMTNALTKAVEKGTAKSIFTPNLKMAGKTGTARFEYWKPGPENISSKFRRILSCGQSEIHMFVMINQPDPSKRILWIYRCSASFQGDCRKDFP
jgi:cell division protein FtsI (penicillin-binding protein 3)